MAGFGTLFQSDPSSSGSSLGFANPMIQQGDLIVGVTLGVASRLASSGTTGQILASGGATAIPFWITLFTDWNSASFIPTPNTGAFGTVTSVQLFSRREGDSLHVRGVFTAGTTGGSFMQFAMPVAMDFTKLPTATQGTVVGTIFDTTNTSAALFPGEVGAVFYDGGSTNILFVSLAETTGGLVKSIGTALTNSNTVVTLDFSAPISGWSAVK